MRLKRSIALAGFLFALCLVQLLRFRESDFLKAKVFSVMTKWMYGKKHQNEKWRKYMPETDRVLSQIESGIVRLSTDISSTTDANHTLLTVIKFSDLEVGDKLEGFIQARDYAGREKHYGGDYFRVRLVSVLCE